MNPLEEPISWKILMVDDDEDDYVLAKDVLADARRGRCIVEWANSYEAGRQALSNGHYDAVLMDYNLGLHNGLDLIREAVGNGFQPPFILYTGHGSYQIDQEALRAGATFYLTKGETSALMLERGIRYAIERKQIEAALQQRSKELGAAQAAAENEKLRLEAVMEALPVGVAITDAQGGNVRSNSAFEKAWGGTVPNAESISDYGAFQAWWADTGQALRPEEWASAQAVQQDRVVAGQFLRIMRFDGRLAYVLNSAAPVHDVQGKVVGSAVAIQDVTALSEAQEELRKSTEALRMGNLALQDSEQKYLMLFQYSAIAVALTKIPENVFVDVNDAFEKLFGFTCQEVLGKTSLELGIARPEEHAVTVAAVRQYGLQQGAEKHFRTKSGEELVALINVGSVESGGQQYAITTILDITGRKRVEEKLQAEIAERVQIEAALQQQTKELEAAQAAAENERLRLAAVMEALPVGVVITDEQGGSLENNRAFELVWGTSSPPPLSGTDFADYKAWWADTGEEVRPEEWASVQAVRQGKVIAAQHFRIRRLDGTYGYALNAAAPIRDLQGKIVGSAVAIQDVTLLSEAEEELRASEERFRSVLDNSRDVIYSFNIRTGRFEYISPSVESVMGFSAAELMALDSQSSLAMVHPDDLPGLKEGMARLLETGRGELEYRQRTKDGSYCWLSNHASIIYDEAGRPLNRQGNIRDVTHLKQVAAELRQSEAKYHNLFDTMDEAFCIIEVIFDAQDRPVDYRFLETNAVFEAQTGLYQAQGKLMRQMAPAHEEYWFQIYGKIALTGEPQRFMNEARALNRWYDVYAYRIGKPEDHHVAILFNDISAHKLLEAELKESERKYRELVQFAPAAIYELDFRTQRFISVNDAMCQMSGYTREELLQMTPEQLLDEPSLRLFQKRTAQWLAGEKPDENIEYRVLVKDGSECYAFLNVTFNRDEAGRPLGATVIAYDITERRRADLLLKERSEAIQEYSRRLERSNRELENFAFIVSHDLQEPLRKIEKFGGLLREGTGLAVGETERLYIERMQDAAGRMRQMIDDLLALSRVSSAGNVFAQVDLNRVVRAVQEDLESRLKPVDGKISCEVLPVIEADPTQMHQLFQNLIGNAIKFRQPGVPPLIRISACLDSEQTITLLVADNGIGFDEKYVDQIFEPFKRLHGRSEYEGNGIGLAICKRIAERHHGAITAHSHPDHGATFSITLPLKQN